MSWLGYDRTSESLGFTDIASKIPTVLKLETPESSKQLSTYFRGEGSDNVLSILKKRAGENGGEFNILVLYGHGCNPSCGKPGMIRVSDITIAPQTEETIPLVINGNLLRYRYRIMAPEELGRRAKTVLYNQAESHKIKAIWIVGCHASGEVANEIAKTTKLPVISTDGVAWARLQNNMPVVFSVDPKPENMSVEDYTKARNRDTAPFAGQVRYKSSWSITFP